MRTLSVISLIILVGILLPGCNRKKDPEEQRLSWSTESPLSIPYRIRFQRFERNNLVRNHSFETGRTFILDSLKTSFVIDAWQQIGQHVEWVDTHQDSLFRADEALSGFRAVKIARSQAYETDEQGEGIMSEFIKVIPGNYRLSFYTRLKNIRPVKGRLGIRMFDAVSVRLLFFDKSKIALDHAHDFPLAGQKVDNSFKSLSLANYNSIDKFGWGKIIGKSAEFPFPEGDLPTRAHYVKIFIGLKGTGTMWIDSVNFSYTRRNFSPWERMLRYTDTSWHMPPFILPTPKKTERMESIVFSSGESEQKLPLIVLPSDADKLTRDAAEVLRSALAGMLGNEGQKDRSGGGIRIIESGMENIQADRDLVFVLGNTDLFRPQEKELPFDEIRDHPQGYFIYSTPDMPRVVFLNGNNSTGIFYAAVSAVQLIDGKNPVFHNARVIDYPDFDNRFCTLGELPVPGAPGKVTEMMRELLNVKINGAFYFVGKNQNPARPGSLNDASVVANLPGLFRIGEVIQGNRQEALTYFSPIVYAPDLRFPEDSSLCYPFPVRLPADLEIEKRLPAVSQSDETGSTIVPRNLRLPPAFNNQLLDYSGYADQPSMDYSLTWLYSGSSFYSLNTDDADLARFSAFSKGSPVFMDNSMRAFSPGGKYGGAFPYYPGKMRLYNIFEPFNNEMIREQFPGFDKSLFWINFPAGSEIEMIRMMSAADFMWNARDYMPDASLWKVLFSRYGGEAARILVRYADQYALILEILCKLERNEPIPRSLKNIQADLTGLASLADELKRVLGEKNTLLREIVEFNAAFGVRMEKYLSPSAEILK